MRAENRHLYEAELEASFRLRHRLYSEERGWNAFQRPDGREVDQYDTSTATYLLAIVPGGEVIGGCRLLPTIGQAVLQEFKALKGGYALPRSPDILHFSRFVVAKERREDHSFNSIACRILAGVQEYCLAENIAQLSAVARLHWVAKLLQLCWNPQPLAPPERLWNETVVVTTYDISEVAHKRTCAVRGIEGSVLVRRGITRPLVPPASGFGRYS